MIAYVDTWIRRAYVGGLAIALIATSSAALLAQPASHPIEAAPRGATNQVKDNLMNVSDQKTSAANAAEMAAAAKLTTKGTIGAWTAKAKPETRPRSCRPRRATLCA